MGAKMCDNVSVDITILNLTHALGKIPLLLFFANRSGAVKCYIDCSVRGDGRRSRALTPSTSAGIFDLHCCTL
jgi:hypothetical protein